MALPKPQDIVGKILGGVEKSIEKDVWSHNYELLKRHPQKVTGHIRCPYCGYELNDTPSNHNLMYRHILSNHEWSVGR